jgi:hypothetical protein
MTCINGSSVSPVRSGVGRGPHFKVKGDQDFTRSVLGEGVDHRGPRSGRKGRKETRPRRGGQARGYAILWFFCFRGRGTILLWFLGGTTHLTHLSRLEFGDDRYTRNRLLDHIDDDGFNPLSRFFLLVIPAVRPA